MRRTMLALLLGALAGTAPLLAPVASAAPAAPALTITTSPVTSVAYGNAVIVRAKATGGATGLDGDLKITGFPTGAPHGCAFSGGGSSTVNTLGESCKLGLPAGAYTFTATYSGGSNYSSASASTPFTVTQARTTATLAAQPPKTAHAGDAVTFTAGVTTAGGVGVTGGTVAFTSNGTTISGCGAEAVTKGIATCATKAPSPGTYTITAAYSGTANDGSSSATAGYVVTQQPGSVRGGSPGPGSVRGGGPAPGSVRGGSPAPGSVRGGGALAASGSRTRDELVLAWALLVAGGLLLWAGRERRRT